MGSRVPYNDFNFYKIMFEYLDKFLKDATKVNLGGVYLAKATDKVLELEAYILVLRERDEKYCNTISGLQAELATLREGIQEGIYSLTCRRCWGAEQTIKLLQALLEVKGE